jgi:sigma-B regulation protein RsbU (phosphoserine phosphatase)
MTLFFGYVDSGRNTVCYCNAGHDHPYFFSANKEPRRLKEGGIILSVMDDYPYQEETFPVNVGDVLVVYSDGITEALNDRRQQFSEKRLLKVLEKNRHKPATEIIDAIFEAAQRHMLAYPQYDDMTVIVIKRVE